MIAALAHNICSPLGWSSSENFSAVVAGRSALMLHTGKWGLPDAFTASLFPQGAIEAAFEQLLVLRVGIVQDIRAFVGVGKINGTV